MEATVRSFHSISQERRSSIVALDLMRGLAALTVLLVHVRSVSFVEFAALPADQKTTLIAILFGLTRSTRAQEAVLIFFVLSGFLVGGQLLSRVKKGTFDLATYFIARCSRIFLPLIPACIFTALISLFVFDQQVSAILLLANMTGLNGVIAPTLVLNFPLWSLAYEIWFYVVGGAIAYMAAKGTSIAATIILATSAVIFSILAASFLLYWAFGALMVMLLRTKFKEVLFAGGISLLAIGAVLHELSIPSKSLLNVAYIPIEASHALICLGVSFSVPFLCSQAVEKALAWLIAPARALAAFSYTLYLTHYPINFAMNTIFPRSTSLTPEALAYFGLRISICLFAAALFYFCFERYTTALRRTLLSMR
jgi:peptidoglycan/LPS O-acetylase OafA/YrhL